MILRLTAPSRPPIVRLKWTPDDFAAAPEGGLPIGKAFEEWSYGDLDAGFARHRGRTTQRLAQCPHQALGLWALGSGRSLHAWNPSCRAARSRITSSAPPPMALTFTSR